jgi:alkyl hydroperoxide reductase subunit AhpC
MKPVLNSFSRFFGRPEDLPLTLWSYRKVFEENFKVILHPLFGIGFSFFLMNFYNHIKTVICLFSVTLTKILKQGKMATLRLGDIAPDFTAETTQGKIHFHEWLGDSWGVLFSHPADFTPVCTTELGTVANYYPEFAKRNAKVIALSVDDLPSHLEWIKDINETQNTTVNFPIIADEDKHVADLYDMLHPNASDKFTVRSVFIIGPDKKIKLMLSYPASTGRNFDEILRVIDSLQLTADYSVATPANWKDGEDVVIATAIQNSEIPAKFPKGSFEIKPYLRMTPQPNK